MQKNPRALNSRQLEAFRAVMLAGSITGGSRLLSISQPAVTRLIRDLELDLRMALFLREGASVIPTQEARELFREVERHFVSTERIREAAMAIREYNTGRLRIASILALAQTCIPSSVEEFSRSYPDILVSVHSGASVDIIDLVASGSVDISFIARPPGRNDLDFEATPPSEAVCLLPRHHPLAEWDVIGPKELDGQDFIALGPSSLMRMELAALLHGAGSHPRVRVESLFSSTVVSYVSRGLGLAIVDPVTAASSDPLRIAVRRFAPRVTYELSIVYAPHVARSPPQRAFAQAFLASYEREISITRELISPDRARVPDRGGEDLLRSDGLGGVGSSRQVSSRGRST